MNSKQIGEFKKQLQMEEKALVQQISRLEKTGIGDAMSDSLSELSVYDNHPADIGDELFERSKDTALRDNAHILLESVEAALEAIEKGSYGYCNMCGEFISLDRLKAVPWALECADCQRKVDDADDAPRPLEEEVLEPPFQRTFLDRSETGFVGFDGEDALQAVLRYGSSDTPQDIPGAHDYTDLFPNSHEPIGTVQLADAIPFQNNDDNLEPGSRSMRSGKNSKDSEGEITHHKKKS